ncbi:AN1-type zinc finger domain-containing protein [Methanoregula sp.]|uniref:AN1-type zinc finger domain-containing protein n=1 Tax=Methanoregula sp. TaxID=2052170 RepID=UPI003C795BF9
MPRCDFCGKNVSLPFHCQYCGKNFCDEHRLPPNHACAGLAAWKKDHGTRCGHPVRVGRGHPVWRRVYGGAERKKTGAGPDMEPPLFQDRRRGCGASLPHLPVPHPHRVRAACG